VSSTLTGRATFILDVNNLLIAENDALLEFAAPLNVAVRCATRAGLKHGLAIEDALALRASAKN
jgi:hypothetical protein